MSILNSIQRGTVAIASGASSATVTISAVDVAKTELRFLGGSGVSGTTTLEVPRIELTDSTTITVTVLSTAASTLTISWELTEWS